MSATIGPIQSLEEDGLVQTLPRVGTRVVEPGREEIRERYEVREALETHAARLYAVNADIRQKLELERMAEHLDAMFNRTAAADGDDRDFRFAVHSFHLQLHLKIAEYAGCAALARLIERNQILVFNWLYDVASSRPPLPPRFHRELVAGLNTGEVEQADKVMRSHIRYGLQHVLTVLGNHSTVRASVRTSRKASAAPQ